MRNILVIENSARDAERFSMLLSDGETQVEICSSGSEAERLISLTAGGFAAAIILWEIQGPPFGFELLKRCKQLWPSMPVVVVSGMLDATLAARAHTLGARDFLEKPLDSSRVKSCVETVLAGQDPLSPLVQQIRQTIIGESSSLLSTLRQVAKVIPHNDVSVLLIGEPGTGKELLAQAIHRLGGRSQEPRIAVNVGEIPSTLIESTLFGHEKGAFTGAHDRHLGLLEMAGRGTLILDEIGDLEISLQGKLLRVIQEKEFRRIKSTKPLSFQARLICATNRDVAMAVTQGSFRRDLFDRIAEVTIHVPPLRERKEDVDVLLKYFLRSYKGDRDVRFARESLTILRSYSFPGNIRELENFVKSSLIECEGDVILPQHLPLPMIAASLGSDEETPPRGAPSLPSESALASTLGLPIKEFRDSLPENWLDLPYREVIDPVKRAMERVYLKGKLERWHYNITRAATEAGIDTKTFRKRWKESGLPPLSLGEENPDG